MTIGAKYMAVMDGEGIPAADNLNVKIHPSWSQISVLDVGSDGHTNFDEYIWIDPKIWDLEQPQFTCSPPCRAKIPPWKGATSTVNYPLVTVSDGTWTSTITQPPVTITEWVFEAVTITEGQGDKQKRALGDTIMLQPTLATTPFWPAFRYRGRNGATSTTSATGPFPTPPPYFGPNAPAPPSGRWPKRQLQGIMGSFDSPLVNECFFTDFVDINCLNKIWGIIGDGSGGDDDYGDAENMWDQTSCPLPTTTSTTITTKTSTTTSARPTTSQYEQGDARTNSLRCYNKGEKTEGERMHNAAKSFCGAIDKSLLGPKFFKRQKFPFPYNGGFGTVSITISLEVKAHCSFGTYHKITPANPLGYDIAHFDEELCEHYLSVPTDSCNCAGVNGKQGGVLTNNCYVWRIDPQLSF